VKLNMGCGYNKIPGYVNVDASAVCQPDVLFDLETLPWPWETSAADSVVFNHSLEHMGQDPKVFLGMMKELYRICRHGAEISITVPHPRHDHFIGDPTHVRPITALLLNLFDKEQNDHWKSIGAATTPLAHYLGVNFKIVGMSSTLDEPYNTMFAEKKITPEQLNKLERDLNNVVVQVHYTLTALKT
jgi:hypothetical protein